MSEIKVNSGQTKSKGQRQTINLGDWQKKEMVQKLS
jgi:hypothetical protein